MKLHDPVSVRKSQRPPAQNDRVTFKRNVNTLTETQRVVGGKGFNQTGNFFVFVVEVNEEDEEIMRNEGEKAARVIETKSCGRAFIRV